MAELKTIAKIIQAELNEIERKEISLDAKPSLISYRENKDAAIVKSVFSNISLLRKELWRNSPKDETQRREFSRLIKLIDELENHLKAHDVRRAKLILDELAETNLAAAEKKETGAIKLRGDFRFPSEIRPDMEADIAELERTFNSACYRASIILCGRLLESALHRKFYEKTGNDILEKHPEIGLGKIIAKLEELNVVLPPGLTQQIHLINQARIHSVHKKKEAMLPTREQAHATVLFTADVLRKLFF